MSALRLLAGLVLLAALTACAPKLELKGSDISDASIGGDFTLTDQTGQPRHLSDFKGKVVALFFGYTHCPDVCPTTMLEYADVLKKLGPDADKVQVLFVTVDPARDSPQVLASYLPHFDKRVLGLSGKPDDVSKVEAQFKVVAQRVETPGGGYSMDHSAGSYLLDKEGKPRVYQAYGTAADSIAHDIRELLR